ncbi:hypothetical protein GA0115255_118796 [Streptomyces sp. Ncost-T6T-2b]|nr:hypothetical protein GA0115255_118796 [Streptomyces sp. Ncost-T6T-2b]
MRSAVRPACSSALVAAATAISDVASDGSAQRRARMPVLRSIHSAVTPMRGASSSFPTIRSGTYAPVDRMPTGWLLMRVRPPGGSAGARRWRPASPGR